MRMCCKNNFYSESHEVELAMKVELLFNLGSLPTFVSKNSVRVRVVIFWIARKWRDGNTKEMRWKLKV